jgi:hypothetical protein
MYGTFGFPYSYCIRGLTQEGEKLVHCGPGWMECAKCFLFYFFQFSGVAEVMIIHKPILAKSGH